MVLSVIHEFTILYSKRIHQKDKKWEDGRLKYYEFNNKLEIISDDAIVVASDFYPSNGRHAIESGNFESGKTYVLPSGQIIVEFIEALGCFRRDVSNVVKRPQAKLNVFKMPSPTPYAMECSNWANQTEKKKMICPPVVERRSSSIKIEEQQISSSLNQVLFQLKSSKNTSSLDKIQDRIYKWDISLKRSKVRIYPGSNKMSQQLGGQNVWT